MAPPSATYSDVATTSPPTPKVDYLDLNTSSISKFVTSIKRNGGVIIRNFVPTASLDTIESDIRPYLEGDSPWDGRAFPPESRRVTGVITKSPTFLSAIVMHPQFREICDALLSVTTVSHWGEHPMTNTSRPVMGGSVVFGIRPGAQAQPLHRDDMPWHASSPRIMADEYEPGRDAGITLFVAGTRLTKANGATRFCPGSHLEASGEKPKEEAAVYAEMERGDALVMLSSCYHGGSANTTVDEERLVYSVLVSKGFLRQGENQYIVIPREQAASWPDETLKWLGYATSEPLLGFVDYMDPLVAIKGKPEATRTDITGVKE